MDIPFSGEIARQGFGYVLFLLSLAGNIYQYRKNIDLFDKRLDDEKQRGNLQLGAMKDLTFAVSSLQKTVDGIVTYMQNIGRKD